MSSRMLVAVGLICMTVTASGQQPAEHATIKRWRTERHHAPSHDLDQPIDRKSAEEVGRMYLAFVAEVANRPMRPQWNGDSFFKRFAR